MVAREESLAFLKSTLLQCCTSGKRKNKRLQLNVVEE
jgi:hypothetical protein